MKKAAKIFLIIGMIATPLAQLWTTVCLLFVYLIGIFYFPIAVVLSVLAIVFGLKAIKALDSAKCRADLPVKWSVLSLIFVSLLGGIFMLCLNDSHFE